MWIKLLLLIKRCWISNYYIIHLDQNSQAYSHSIAHMHRNQHIENKGVQLKKKTSVPRKNFHLQISLTVYSTLSHARTHAHAHAHAHAHSGSDLKCIKPSCLLLNSTPSSRAKSYTHNPIQENKITNEICVESEQFLLDYNEIKGRPKERLLKSLALKYSSSRALQHQLNCVSNSDQTLP